MTPSAARVRAATGAALLAVGALLGCGDSSPQTGIVVEITTDLSVPGEIDELLLRITSGTGATLYQQAFPLVAQQHTLPVRVGVQPSGGTTTPFRIEAIGRLGPDAVVSRSATLTFVSGRVVLLRLPLLATCLHVICAQAAETCGDHGSCVPDTVDPTQLPPYHPGGTGGAGGSGGTSSRGGTTGSGGTSGTGGTSGSGGLAGAGGTGGSSGGAAGTGGTGGRGGSSGTGGAAGTGGSGGRGGTGGSGGAAGTGGSGGRGGTGGTGGVAGTGGRGGTGGSGGAGGTGGGVVATLNNGLVGYWAFDQTGTTFPDYSGNANTMSGRAGYWTASGQVGGALDLTSAPDYAAASTQGTASINTITSAISIAVWIVPQAGTVRTMVSRYLGGPFWKLGLGDNGALRFTAGTSVAQAPGAVGDGSQWMHVAATYDGTGVRLYVGGNQVAQAVFGAVSLVGGPPDGGAGGFGLDVGGAYDNINAIITENFKGRLDELTIYNRALTPSEVDALAHGALPARR
jgi:hypothetical protein